MIFTGTACLARVAVRDDESVGYPYDDLILYTLFGDSLVLTGHSVYKGQGDRKTLCSIEEFRRSFELAGAGVEYFDTKVDHCVCRAELSGLIMLMTDNGYLTPETHEAYSTFIESKKPVAA